MGLIIYLIYSKMKKGTKVKWTNSFGRVLTGRVIELKESNHENSRPLKVRPDDKSYGKKLGLKLKSVTEIPEDYK